MLREYVDMKEEQADMDIRLITRCGPAPESIRIQGRNVHRRGQSSEDPCQKIPSRVSKNTPRRWPFDAWEKTEGRLGKTGDNWERPVASRKDEVRSECLKTLLRLQQ